MATQVQTRDAMQFINQQDAATIERNHEVYTNNGEVIMSSTVKALLPAAA